MFLTTQLTHSVFLNLKSAMSRAGLRIDRDILHKDVLDIPPNCKTLFRTSRKNV
jgi:hypothetical protein